MNAENPNYPDLDPRLAYIPGLVTKNLFLNLIIPEMVRNGFLIHDKKMNIYYSDHPNADFILSCVNTACLLATSEFLAHQDLPGKFYLIDQDSVADQITAEVKGLTIDFSLADPEKPETETLMISFSGTNSFIYAVETALSPDYPFDTLEDGTEIYWNYLLNDYSKLIINLDINLLNADLIFPVFPSGPKEINFKDERYLRDPPATLAN